MILSVCFYTPYVLVHCPNCHSIGISLWTHNNSFGCDTDFNKCHMSFTVWKTVKYFLKKNAVCSEILYWVWPVLECYYFKRSEVCNFRTTRNTKQNCKINDCYQKVFPKHSPVCYWSNKQTAPTQTRAIGWAVVAVVGLVIMLKQTMKVPQNQIF